MLFAGRDFAGSKISLAVCVSFFKSDGDTEKTIPGDKEDAKSLSAPEVILEPLSLQVGECFSLNPSNLKAANSDEDSRVDYEFRDQSESDAAGTSSGMRACLSNTDHDVAESSVGTGKTEDFSCANLDQGDTSGDTPVRFSCKECKQTFRSGNSLKRHLCGHVSGEAFQCEICKKSWPRKSALQIHLRVHRGEMPSKCDICSQTFVQKANLERHSCHPLETKSPSTSKNLKLKSASKQLKCDYCGRIFGRKDHLVEHIRTHTGERPYECDHCGKSFTRNDNLIKHIRTHTGEKPYDCDRCGKCFTEKGNLIKHIRTHTGEKPYKCDHCGKCFSSKCKIRRHMRLLTGNNPLV
ncbi:Zinc finger protein 436 [Frankliniella fusca]|uniref:Zinc finger protein 436 n=1 Tax=Frankliniella fusca TaxID=407009 RepID=A0AAE1GU69_9NEOP|nr:Zinc finger protein 436 [Frankliniella fusca]